MPGRENHRQRLIDGALECLREKGYAHTTARDIAAAAHANLGSIGYHFGSKEALQTEAMCQGLREWMEYIAASVLARQDGGPLDQLAASWSAVAESFEQQRGLMVAFFEAATAAARSPVLREQLGELYQETVQATTAMIEAATAEADVLGERTARTLAALLVAIVDGLALQWLVVPELAPRPEELTELINCAMSVDTVGARTNASTGAAR